MDNNNPTGANPAPAENQPNSAQEAAPAQSAPVNPVPPAQSAVPAGKSGSSTGVIIAIVSIVVALLVCGVGVLMIIAPWKIISTVDLDDKGGSSEVTPAPTTNKGNCAFFECLSKVSIDNTKEEVEAIFGFAPEAEIDEDADTEKYTWNFDDNHSIVMNVSTFLNRKSTISIRLDKYDNDELQQKGVTFDNLSQIKAKMSSSDGITYEEVKELMGGVDGIVTEVTSWTKYEWRSTDSKGYASISFSDGKCMFLSAITY